MDHGTAIQYLKLVSFPTAFLLAGYSLSFSQSTVPLLFDVRPQVSLPVFKGVYYNGAVVVAPGSILSAAASAYLAYAVPERRLAWTTAAVAVFAAQPWTLIVMLPGIHRLIEISQSDSAVQAKAEQTLEHRQLLKAWVRQNWIRATTFFVGGVAGLLAATGP